MFIMKSDMDFLKQNLEIGIWCQYRGAPVVLFRHICMCKSTRKMNSNEYILQ